MEPIELYYPSDLKSFIAALKELKNKGYKYIVRDPGMKSVACFTAKPKKYNMGDEDFFWGYSDIDLKASKPAHPIFYDAPGIYSNGKQATFIEDWLKVYGVKS